MSYSNIRGENIEEEPENRNICPECKHNIIEDNDRMEYYCSKCGLIVSMSIAYVAGNRINLPYGLLL